MAAPTTTAQQQVDFSQWAALEAKVTKNRLNKCNTTLAKLLGGDASNGKQPRVGMAFSGGGWRAMMSAVALMDGLSVPLDASETAANEEGIKLMDTISHIFGLSGGSWAAFVTLAGGERNPFHHDPTDKTPIGPDDRKRHPWLHGQQNKFDPEVHEYAGLRFMTDASHVSQACYRGGAATRFVSLSSGLADTTFGSALATKLLGTTLVERWSNFLANDILSFKDHGELKAPTKEAQEKEKQQMSAEEPTAEDFEAAQKGNASAINAVDNAVKGAASVAAKDPNIGSKARNVTLSSLRPLIESGDFPFVANTAIADKRGMQVDKYGSNSRLYDWVEISPFFIRNSVSGNYTENVDDCGCYFLPENAPGRERSDMRLHNYMAVCGSAFACDVGAILPKGVCNAVRDNVKLKSSPILGGGLTEIIYGKDEKAPVCVCRDAGIDFNVPFPPLLSESHRQFDIIIAMDAGADSTNAYELERAAELGYLKLQYDGTKPLDIFPQGNRVRVYRCVDGGPTIIYFLGLTKRPTAKIIYNPEQVLRDTASVRKSVMDELIPILLSELRIKTANNLASSGMLRQQSSASVGAGVKLDSRSSRTLRRGAAAGGGDDDDDTNSLSPHSPGTPYGTAQPPNGTTVSASGTRRGFSTLAESIIVNAATHGMLRDSIDSFFVVERAVTAALPQADRKLKTIAALEEEALAAADGIPIALPLKDRLAAIGPDLVEVLAEIGVLRRIDWTDLLKRRVELVEEWVDFYVVTALVRHILPTHVTPDVAARALKAIARDTVAPRPDASKLELIFVNSTRFQATSRASMLLGSVVSKLLKHNCDISNVVSGVLLRRYLTQIQKSEATTEEALELLVAPMLDHLADCFAEMLSFDHLNIELDLNPTDVNMLKCFTNFVKSFVEGVAANNAAPTTNIAGEPTAPTTSPNSKGILAPARYILLLAEAIARHPSQRSFVLLRLLCADRTTTRQFASFPHLGSPATFDPTGNIGALRAVIHTSTGNKHLSYPEDKLRLAAASYDSPDGYHAKREEIQKVLFDAQGGVGGRANGIIPLPQQMTLEIAFQQCFASAIHHLMRSDDLDNANAYTTMLACTSFYANMNHRKRKGDALFVLWSEGAASQLFRVNFSAECVKQLQLFEFHAAYVTAIKIPTGTPADTIDEVLTYAERNRQFVKIVEVADMSTLTPKQKHRLERINSAILQTAHEVREVVTGKITAVAGGVADAVGGLKGGLKGFFGKK